MRIIKTKFKDLIIVKQKNNIDKRGTLREIFNDKILKKNLFLNIVLHQKNVLRGFHFQTKFKQSKYINVVKGKILDVVIDLRKNSKTFGKIFKIVLSQKNALSLFVPAGFAHAYYSFEKENIIYYKLDNYYSPKFEKGIIYNDKSLNIKWPNKIVISKKDKNLISFKEFKKNIKVFNLKN